MKIQGLFITMTTSFIQLSNGQNIHYFEINHELINKKPTLFFIHGNFSNWMWWADTINVLKHFEYHIIAVDQRGFGESSYNKRCSCFKDWAQDLVDFCKIKKIKECTAIGWSFGGTISMKFAEIAPDIVTRIILTCSVSHEGLLLYTGNTPCKTMQELKQNAKIKFMTSIVETKNREAMNQIFKTVLLTHTKDFPLELCQQMVNGSLNQKCYLDVMYSIANPDIDINKIKAKVLMIHGREDNVVPLQGVVPTGQFFKNFQIWENHAHMIPIEDVQRYAEAVRKFVEQK